MNEKNKHYFPGEVLGVARQTQILLVGVGGTGSQILSGLARMNQTLLALGGRGLDVVVADADRVSRSNVGRQMYSTADIGKHKASVSVTRLNMFFGTAWRAVNEMIGKNTRLSNFRPTLLISAVDSGNARDDLSSFARGNGLLYWMDTGNTLNTGQVILGSFWKAKQPSRSFPNYLPNVLDLYPDIAEEDGKAYQGPSCSVREALERQDLFVNQWVATAALEILWKIFRHACVTEHGAFIDLMTMNVRPLPVDREVWKRMGWAGNESGRKGGKKK
jgi:PRTRC genetic system ThiF family protein